MVNVCYLMLAITFNNTLERNKIYMKTGIRYMYLDIAAIQQTTCATGVFFIRTFDGCSLV